jgi:O-antigen/teichoic acid export membrane protein
MGLIGMGLGSWLVGVIFGPDYALGGRLLGYALWLLIPYSCGYALYSVYLSQGREHQAFRYAVIGSIAFTLSMFIFAPGSNIPGALVSLATGMIMWTGSMVVSMSRRNQLSISFAVGKPGIAVLLGLATFAGLQFLNSWLALCLGLIILFGGSILIGGLSAQEKDLITSLFRKNMS